jgi:hypothetical protein
MTLSPQTLARLQATCDGCLCPACLASLREDVQPPGGQIA